MQQQMLYKFFKPKNATTTNNSTIFFCNATRRARGNCRRVGIFLCPIHPSVHPRHTSTLTSFRGAWCPFCLCYFLTFSHDEHTRLRRTACGFLCSRDTFSHGVHAPLVALHSFFFLARRQTPRSPRHSLYLTLSHYRYRVNALSLHTIALSLHTIALSPYRTITVALSHHRTTVLRTFSLQYIFSSRYELARHLH